MLIVLYKINAGIEMNVKCLEKTQASSKFKIIFSYFILCRH